MKFSKIAVALTALALVSSPVLAQDDDDDGPLSGNALLILGGVGAAITAFVAAMGGNDENPVSP